MLNFLIGLWTGVGITLAISWVQLWLNIRDDERRELARIRDEREKIKERLFGG